MAVNTHPLGNMHDFTSEEVQQLLHNKFIAVLGDSIHRSIYKDLIYILQTDKLLSEGQLHLKQVKRCVDPVTGEIGPLIKMPVESFANDCLVEGDILHNNTNYREVRQYCSDHHLVRFYFITRVYSDYMESILSDFERGPSPDVVIFNSCLWDLNRYNEPHPSEPPLAKAFKEYRQNMEKLFTRLSHVLPAACLVIWNTATPIQKLVKGAYLEKDKHGKKPKSCDPIAVVKANFYSAIVACRYQLDVVDLHYCFHFYKANLDKDGVHWNGWVHRCITKLLLTHVADAWGVRLEKRRPQGGIEWNRNAPNESFLERPPHPLPPPLLPPPPPPHVPWDPPPFANDFSPLRFNPVQDPYFQNDFISCNRPLDGYISFEYSHASSPCLEEPHHGRFHSPGNVHSNGWRPPPEPYENSFHGPGDVESNGWGPPPKPHTSHFHDPGNVQSNGWRPPLEPYENSFHGPGDVESNGWGPPPKPHTSHFHDPGNVQSNGWRPPLEPYENSFHGPGDVESSGWGPHPAPHPSHFHDPGNVQSNEWRPPPEPYDNSFHGPGDVESSGWGPPLEPYHSRFHDPGDVESNEWGLPPEPHPNGFPGPGNVEFSRWEPPPRRVRGGRRKRNLMRCLRPHAGLCNPPYWRPCNSPGAPLFQRKRGWWRPACDL